MRILEIIPWIEALIFYSPQLRPCCWACCLRRIRSLSRKVQSTERVLKTQRKLVDIVRDAADVPPSIKSTSASYVMGVSSTGRLPGGPKGAPSCSGAPSGRTPPCSISCNKFKSTAAGAISDSNHIFRPKSTVDSRTHRENRQCLC